tara:strand:+ start:248 stop:517 length:270 start_codon:yes stop_codon:yes gene_type:complete
VKKLTDLLKESYVWERKFGEKLPTLDDVKRQKEINEAKKIDSKEWKKIKNQIEDQIDDLVKIGEDYAVFQSAKYTAKTLKKIQKLWKSL